MLINADAKQLEWRAVVHLSGDKIGIEEINAGLDFHADNQKTFKLPSRDVSKIFLFRAIYKGSAYAYSVDPLFAHIGGERFWQGVIDKFYEKYAGIFQYHNRIISEVVDTGKLIVPDTGRTYLFEQRQVRGVFQWPVTDICNYPVQGFSADLMSIIRVALHTKLQEQGIITHGPFDRTLWCNTVHDSILLDVDNQRETWYNICIEIEKAFRNTGKNFEAIFHRPLLVPMACDITIGNNWLHMHKVVIKGI